MRYRYLWQRELPSRVHWHWGYLRTSCSYPGPRRTGADEGHRWMEASMVRSSSGPRNMFCGNQCREACSGLCQCTKPGLQYTALSSCGGYCYDKFLLVMYFFYFLNTEASQSCKHRQTCWALPITFQFSLPICCITDNKTCFKRPVCVSPYLSMFLQHFGCPCRRRAGDSVAVTSSGKITCHLISISILKYTESNPCKK